MNAQYFQFARDELTDHLLYQALARHERRPENRALLEKLAAQELSHYEFWKTFLPDANIRPNRLILYGIPLLRSLLGVTFTTKLLESQEESAIARYEQELARMPEQSRAHLLQIIEDEKRHEQQIIGGIQEKRVTYVGSIALGLADAIVEITGVHAGFLGITGSTLFAGVSGIIVGISAAISMGAAAYLQAKQDPEKSAIASGITTGITYLGSVMLLALPYFLIHAMFIAFIVSTLVGVAMLAIFTFYSTVVFDRKFFSEFGEAVALMLVTALVTFFLGDIIGSAFNLTAFDF